MYMKKLKTLIYLYSQMILFASNYFVADKNLI